MVGTRRPRGIDGAGATGGLLSGATAGIVSITVEGLGGAEVAQGMAVIALLQVHPGQLQGDRDRPVAQVDETLRRGPVESRLLLWVKGGDHLEEQLTGVGDAPLLSESLGKANPIHQIVRIEEESRADQIQAAQRLLSLGARGRRGNAYH